MRAAIPTSYLHFYMKLLHHMWGRKVRERERRRRQSSFELMTASCCLTVHPFPWAISSRHCTSLWMSLTCGNCALGRGNLLSVISPFSAIIILFPFILPVHTVCMTFKTLQNGGQLLLWFNYKLTQGHIISPGALAYYSRIWQQWGHVARVIVDNREAKCDHIIFKQSALRRIFSLITYFWYLNSLSACG